MFDEFISDMLNVCDSEIFFHIHLVGVGSSDERIRSKVFGFFISSSNFKTGQMYEVKFKKNLNFENFEEIAVFIFKYMSTRHCLGMFLFYLK